MSSYSSMQKEVKFMEMKLLGICPIKEKFNAASVIEKVVRNKTTLPPEGPSYRLLQATDMMNLFFFKVSFLD